MLINRIGLRNFKCFEDIEVKLSKITLLAGENSSGKSSLLYGLLTPFQSHQFPFYLSPNGKYINMGDFIEMSFNNLKRNRVGVDISINNHFEETYNFESNWVINASNKMPKLHDLRITSEFLGIEIRAKNDFYVLNFNYDEEKHSTSSESVEYRAKFETIKQVIFETLELYQSEPKGKEDDEHNARKLWRVSNAENLQIENLDQIRMELIEAGKPGTVSIISELFDILEQIDAHLNFISSFRLRPERRTYYQQTKVGDKIGTYGENYIDQISEWEDRKSPEFKELKSILKDLNLLRTVKTKKLRGGRFELRVQVKSRGVWASLADVGFGISQFLPIIVADLQLPSRSTLLVAQPEIHLHPSVQASLADYFIRQVKVGEKQYILETHSEYLLNRVRLGIVNGEIKAEDVAIYYFENSSKGSVSHKIEFRKDGQIHNAPQGFFDTYMMDVMEIALAT